MTQLFVFGRPEPKPRQVAVVGSREYRRLDLVRDFVLRLPDGSTVISGGARGVDQTAVAVASARGLKTIVFRPDWRRHGRDAGPMRSVEVVTQAKEVIAFWNGSSRGTLNTLVLARRAGLPMVVLDANGDLLPEQVALRAAEERGIVAAIERSHLTDLLPPAGETATAPDFDALLLELDRQRQTRTREDDD